MKVILSVLLEEMEDKINRQIEVNDNISLKDLCEYIIISMNGNKIPFYILYYKKVAYSPNEFFDDELKLLNNLTLKDLKVKRGSEFCIEYNFDNFYYINVVIDGIYENVNGNETCDFEVLSGEGYGVLDSVNINHLKTLIYKKYVKESYLKIDEKNYLQQKFDCVEVNNKIKEYIKYKEELIAPKRYVFNVSLNEFDSEIKRKIVVNSNVKIYDFCRMIIVSMNGDLSHDFCIKRNKEYLDGEYFNDIELFYLDLKEKQRLKIIYDWGDNWIFNLTVSKIIDNYGECEVLSGKGYGIIDDCGGVWGLSSIFDGDDDSWGEYDINDFDLEKCNEEVKKVV